MARASADKQSYKGRHFVTNQSSFGESFTVTDAAELRQLLHRRCAAATHAFVVNIQSGAVAEGQFSAVDDSGLRVEVFEQSDLAFQPMNVCSVAFFANHRAMSFLSWLLDAGEVLTFQAPAQLSVLEARKSPRLSIADNVELSAEVRRRNGAVSRPRVLDLSETGMLVEFPRDARLELTLGEELAVALAFADHLTQLNAEVRRREGRQFGLFFVDSVEGSEVHVSKELGDILTALR